MSGLRTTTAASLVITAVVAAPLGAAIGPVAQWLGEPVPQVSWTAVASPWFLAAMVGGVAWHTWRLVGGIAPWRSLPGPEADDVTARSRRRGEAQGGAPASDPGRRPTTEHGARDADAAGRARARSRDVGVGRRLQPHQAVNRLVLGKAAALAGAVCSGAYAGFALAALGGVQRQLDGERVALGVAAATGGLALAVAGVLLERACRTQDPEEPDLA